MPNISFDNTQIAFAYKSNKQLKMNVTKANNKKEKILKDLLKKRKNRLL